MLLFNSSTKIFDGSDLILMLIWDLCPNAIGRYDIDPSVLDFELFRRNVPNECTRYQDSCGSSCIWHGGDRNNGSKASVDITKMMNCDV